MPLENLARMLYEAYSDDANWQRKNLKEELCLDWIALLPELKDRWLVVAQTAAILLVKGDR